jgi:ketosteroid isomerase-like protein
LTNPVSRVHLSVVLGTLDARAWLFVFGVFGTACQPPVAAPPPATPLVPARVEVTPSTQAPSPAPPPPPKVVSFAELARKTAETYAGAWKTRDAKTLVASYADEACIQVPGRPDVCGAAAIAGANEALWAEFPDVRTAWSRAWLQGDVLIVESAWTGTNDGAAPGKKPTHKIVGVATVTLSWLLPDGRIRQQRVYADEGSIAMQLGTGATGRPFGGLPTTRERHDATGSATEESNVAAIQNGLATKAASFADDAELVDYSHVGSLPEKKGAGRWIALRTGPLGAPRVTLTHVFGVGDAVICEYEVAGSKEGRPGTVHGVEVLEIKDGKVARALRYRDSLELAPMLALPPPVPSVAS